MNKPEQIVHKMYDNDPYSQWLGIKILEIKEDDVRLKMTIRKEMCNGFGIAHGGISYAFADSTLAFACNTKGIQSLSVDTSINHIKAIPVDTTIFSRCEKIAENKKTALYHIFVENEAGTLFALMKGLMYKTDKEWNL